MKTWIIYSESNKEVVVINAENRASMLDLLQKDLDMRAIIVQDDYILRSTLETNILGITSVSINETI